MAQGTVRVLSERLFFLVFGSLLDMHAFAINALPFHLWALATWFADLALAALIGARLTGSRLAGLAAAILWTSHASITQPLMWASSYNQLLCALCILTAFYARSRWLEDGRRRWIAIEWVAYLAGFGALEIIVMYPFIAVLYSLCLDRRRKGWLSALPLFIPALLFTAVHFFLIPKPQGPYSLAMDQRLSGTFLNYLNWAAAPVSTGNPAGGWRALALISAIPIGIALLAFAAWRARHRDFMPLFGLGWFVLLISPVLPLPEHLTEYYLTIPVLGLAWVAGWAIVSAWRVTGARGSLARLVAVAFAATYLAGSIHQIERQSRQIYARSVRMRNLLHDVNDAAQMYPGSAILLAGVDEALLQSGFEDNPFRLYGLENVYLVPGGEIESLPSRDVGEFSRYMITVPRALDLIDHNQARVLLVSRDRVDEMPRSYAAMLHAGAEPARHDFVNAGDLAYAAQLGSTWYKAENGARWMPRSAEVRLYGIQPAAQTLIVTGFASRDVVASGPVTIHFRGNGRDIGLAVIKKPYGPFSLSLPLPTALIGQSSVQIEVELSKVVRQPGEDRDLGMIFGTFAIR